MNKKTIKREFYFILLSIFMICSNIYFIIPLESNNNVISKETQNLIDDSINNELDKEINVQTSGIGLDPWWNNSFTFRKLINITNPGSEDFVNAPFFSITFNYSKLVAEGKMNSSLKDVRIVENGKICEYWIEKDVPVKGNATIWFKSNCSANTSEYDTYIYYGNNSVGYATKYLMKYNPMGVAWYPLDGDTKDHARLNHGTNNGVSFVNGIKGQCGNFVRGEGDYILIGDKPDFHITMNQTIMMWIKPADLAYRQNPYAKAYGGEGTITLETSGSLSYYYGTTGRNAYPYQGFGSGTGTSQIGHWTHIAIVRDLSNMQLYWYRNGTLRRAGVATYSPAVAGTLPAYLGRGYVYNFNGLIDDF
ncbi:MAG TPA: DUF2341 domain-containing protein, partial [Candidatus Atribacteria bacterium]|nr:DUF2341 domain-containing protein [Candidatus Atribacteria bacterium]